MRRLLPLILLAACSDAKDPATDAPPHTGSDAPAHLDTPPADALGDAGPLRILVVNEVVASGDPDWFEVVNATTSPVELSDFIFVDEKDNFTKAVPFPQMTLAPGAYYAQDCDGTIVPFKLASDEEIWVYRGSDDLLSDGVDWAEGDSPEGSSFARIPDIFGDFQTVTPPTKGLPNQ
ncbi:MAG TPA: hypothetical protein VGM88_22835 [Kofleriaceae bacterium]|jgi:hypothetical protein